MSVRIEPFGTLPDGREVQRYTLERGDMTASLITYGATLQQLTYKGRDLILGYDTLEGYLKGQSFQGATIGRYGNRIGGGRFTLEGQEYALALNENGTGHLHGGDRGFDKRLWHAADATEGVTPAVTFSRLSPDGEEGYPGNLAVSVTFSLEMYDTLRIEYRAKTDAPTVVNLTNHSYFDLDGTGDVTGIILQVDSDLITPVDERLIPTGGWMEVTGTPFDFRQAKPIGQDIGADHPQLALGGGYDHNFLLNGHDFRRVMTAVSPVSGVKLICRTDQPAAQVYTANMLDEPGGKGGRPLARRSALCFETQHCPDSPNKPGFPSTRLDPGEEYHTVTSYQFKTMEE